MGQLKYKQIVILWGTIVAVVLIASEVALFNVLRAMVRETPYVGEKVYDYHVVLVTEEKNASYWDEVLRGAQPLAEANGIVVERQTVDYSRGESISQLIEIATSAKVDGILTCVSTTENVTVAIDKAVAQGLPVVTIGNDDPDSERQSYVGVDYYTLGITMGNLLLSLSPPSRSVMIFTQEPATEKQVSNKILSTSLNATVVQSPINVAFAQSGEGSFAIELLVRAASQGATEVDTIICNNIEDTLTCANSVIENNMVGKIRIIGYNENKEVLDYIRKGVIQATITTDGATVGKNAVQSFLMLQQNNGVNEFVSNKIEVIHPDNVEQYIQKYIAQQGLR